MNRAIVFMFSGQGSQYYHMGKELYENHPRFKLWMDHCDQIARPLLQESLIDILYRQHSKSEPFDRLVHTNPALLCLEFSLSKILMEMDIQPDYVLGYSLGEIIASVVSGALSLSEGIELVIEFAEIFERDANPAAMLAVIDSVNIIEKYPQIFRDCWLAGKNFQSSFVVSGSTEDIQNLQSELDKKQIMSQKLPVNYAFHTQLVAPHEQKFKQLGADFNFTPSRIPIISSLKSEQIEHIDESHFWEVLRKPVEFEQTIRNMVDRDDYIFIDLGPSGTLATFVKYILPANSNSVTFETINQYGKNLSSLEKLKASMPVVDCEPA
ncbi:acyltransferase domain-containing protein [Aliikangiella coralliicola]|nr:acyltransferase domain-containing protein [Aliikangiella coralliicola]